jgi:hypothetical protein
MDCLEPLLKELFKDNIRDRVGDWDKIIKIKFNYKMEKMKIQKIN